MVRSGAQRCNGSDMCSPTSQPSACRRSRRHMQTLATILALTHPLHPAHPPIHPPIQYSLSNTYSLLPPSVLPFVAASLLFSSLLPLLSSPPLCLTLARLLRPLLRTGPDASCDTDNLPATPPTLAAPRSDAAMTSVVANPTIPAMDAHTSQRSYPPIAPSTSSPKPSLLPHDHHASPTPTTADAGQPRPEGKRSPLSYVL